MSHTNVNRSAMNTCERLIGVQGVLVRVSEECREYLCMTLIGMQEVHTHKEE